jgi:hypothetical protein
MPLNRSQRSAVGALSLQHFESYSQSSGAWKARALDGNGTQGKGRLKAAVGFGPFYRQHGAYDAISYSTHG